MKLTRRRLLKPLFDCVLPSPHREYLCLRNREREREWKCANEREVECLGMELFGSTDAGSSWAMWHELP